MSFFQGVLFDLDGFLIDCHKARTNVLTLANHREYGLLALKSGAGKQMRTSHDWFWFGLESGTSLLNLQALAAEIKQTNKQKWNNANEDFFRENRKSEYAFFL